MRWRVCVWDSAEPVHFQRLALCEGERKILTRYMISQTVFWPISFLKEHVLFLEVTRQISEIFWYADDQK